MMNREIVQAIWGDSFIFMSQFVFIMALIGIALLILFWLGYTLIQIFINGKEKIDKFFGRKLA